MHIPILVSLGCFAVKRSPASPACDLKAATALGIGREQRVFNRMNKSLLRINFNSRDALLHLRADVMRASRHTITGLQRCAAMDLDGMSRKSAREKSH